MVVCILTIQAGTEQCQAHLVYLEGNKAHHYDACGRKYLMVLIRAAARTTLSLITLNCDNTLAITHKNLFVIVQINRYNYSSNLIAILHHKYTGRNQKLTRKISNLLGKLATC